MATKTTKKLPSINAGYEIRRKHTCDRCNAVVAGGQAKKVPQWFYRSRTNVDLATFPSIDLSYNAMDPTQASMEKVSHWLERIPDSDEDSYHRKEFHKDENKTTKAHQAATRPNYYDAWYADDAHLKSIMAPIPIGRRIQQRPSAMKRKTQSFSNYLLPNISSKFREGGGPIARPHTPPRFSMSERQKTRMVDMKQNSNSLSYVQSVDQQQGRTYALHDKLKTILNST